MHGITSYPLCISSTVRLQVSIGSNVSNIQVFLSCDGWRSSDAAVSRYPLSNILKLIREIDKLY